MVLLVPVQAEGVRVHAKLALFVGLIVPVSCAPVVVEPPAPGAA
jgi:hypothetical protein